MIKILSILVMCCAGLSAWSQTLEFSQVKLVTTVETVPANKVWKVESVIFQIPHTNTGYATSSSQTCNTGNFYNFGIEINSVPTKTGEGAHSAAYSSVNYMQSYTELPVWLPAGATLSGGPCNNQVSVIEFNIVP